MEKKQKHNRSSTQPQNNDTNNNETTKNIRTTFIVWIENFANEHKVSYITILTLVISAFVAFGSTFGLSIFHHLSEQKEIAQGISNEIDQLYPTLQEQSNLYIDLQQKNIMAPISVDPIYTKDGLYYVYGKDINKLNKELSSKLFYFYLNITKAEEIRDELYKNCLDFKGNPEVVNCNYSYYNARRYQIHERLLHATNDVHLIKPLLNESINNPLNELFKNPLGLL
jgi:hypothetical protein